ncbi:MAG: hypothetical protein WBL35_09905 [Ornithinibacter sp.]
MTAPHAERPHEPKHHEPDYVRAVDDLTERFAGRISRDDVQAAIDEARSQIEPQSTVHDFLELLVERRAREILLARSTSGSETSERV